MSIVAQNTEFHFGHRVVLAKPDNYHLEGIIVGFVPAAEDAPSYISVNFANSDGTIENLWVDADQIKAKTTNDQGSYATEHPEACSELEQGCTDLARRCQEAEQRLDEMTAVARQEREWRTYWHQSSAFWYGELRRERDGTAIDGFTKERLGEVLVQRDRAQKQVYWLQGFILDAAGTDDVAARVQALADELRAAQREADKE